MSESDKGTIVFISDVHGLIPQMNDFFKWLKNTLAPDLLFAVHLGDFWSGRNFNGTEQVFDEFTDIDFLKQLECPVYCLKGNEDLKAPDEWWLSPNIWLMKDQEPFILQEYKVLPIDYRLTDEGEEPPKHPEFSKKNGFDMILSHVPPLGLLDETLHFKTHRWLKLTGSKLVRSYIDNLQPALTLFGHFHYSNYKELPYGLIASLDKLIRVQRFGKYKYKYSFAILKTETGKLTIYWKGNKFLEYHVGERRIIFRGLRDSRHYNAENRNQNNSQ